MTEQLSKLYLLTHPAVYRIRVAGRVDPHLSDFHQSMTSTTFDDPQYGTCTELICRFPDQAALMGFLQYFHSSVISLLSVECLNTTTNCNNNLHQ